MVAEKSALRSTLLAARGVTTPAARSVAAGSLRATVAELLVTVRAKIVAGYVPIGTEPGASGGGPHALPAAEGVLLPVLLPDNDLDWACGDLVPGRGKLFEPSGPRLGVDAITSADVVFVPAVAVGCDGSRLGRGGGSYDRALTRVRPGVPIVALVYDNEFLPSVPAGRRDHPITGVITPSGGFVCLPRHVD